jgi:hypothetical protein
MNDEQKRQIRSLVENRDVEGLIAALTDRNMDVRTDAATALGDIGDERAVGPLITALNDTTDYPVFKVPLQVSCTPIDARGEAALALGKIGGNSAVEALLAVADTNPEKGVNRGLSVAGAVKRALTELGVDASGVVVPKDPADSPARKSSQEMVKTADDLRWGGQLDEAMEWAVRATDTDPSNGYAWMQTGLIEVDRRDAVAATRAFAKAIDVDSGLKGTEPGARLAGVYDALGMRKELNEVRSSLDAAGLRLDPRAEREWEQLVAAVAPGELRAALGLETGEEIVKAEAEAEPVAGVCDICNAPGMGTIVSADQMREAVFKRGFNPFKLGLVTNPMIAIVGEQEAYEHWKNTIVAQDTSDWNIDAKCMAKLEPYLGDAPKATGVHKSTVSVDPAVSAVAGAAAEQKHKETTDEDPPVPAKQSYVVITDPAPPPARAGAPEARAAAPQARVAAPVAAAAAPPARAAKEPGKKRRLPVWAIVLLVLGAATLCAVGSAMVAREPRVVEIPATEVVALQPAEEEPTLPTPELTGVAPEPTVQRAQEEPTLPTPELTGVAPEPTVQRVEEERVEEEAKQVFEISPEPTESISEPTPTPATAAASPGEATASIPTAAPTSAAESTAVLGEWIPVDFMIPNPSLWRDTAEGIYTAVGSEDAFAWSRRAYDGNLMVSLDLESRDNRASGCVVVYGDGQGFSQGNLIFCIDWDGYGLEKHTIYHEGENYLTFVHDSVDLKNNIYSVTIEIIDDVASMYVNGERVFSTFFDTEGINRGGRVGLLKKWFDPEITFSNVQIKALGDEDG